MSAKTCREMFQNWLEANVNGDVMESGVPQQVLVKIEYRKLPKSVNATHYVWLGPKGKVRWHWLNDYTKATPMDTHLEARMKLECYS